MSDVTILAVRDVVRVDHGRIQNLCIQIGSGSAEEVLCRALEDLSEKLTLVGHSAFVAGERELRKLVCGMIPVAEQIGMSTLATVARDVKICIDRGDGIALSATHARLMRVGDRSLCAMWDTQDLSV